MFERLVLHTDPFFAGLKSPPEDGSHTGDDKNTVTSCLLYKEAISGDFQEYGGQRYALFEDATCSQNVLPKL